MKKTKQQKQTKELKDKSLSKQVFNAFLKKAINTSKLGKRKINKA
jgi:hypothetical protein